MKRTIKGLRTDLELKQEQMAERLGVSLPTYKRYENYQARIPAAVLVKIADMCGITDVRTIKYE